MTESDGVGSETRMLQQPGVSFYMFPLSAYNIWLIFTRTVTPLEIFRWFPQIAFTLLTFVRPINVGFSNRFFCLSDKRCLMINIKKNVEEDKS